VLRVFRGFKSPFSLRFKFTLVAAPPRCALGLCVKSLLLAAPSRQSRQRRPIPAFYWRLVLGCFPQSLFISVHPWFKRFRLSPNIEKINAPHLKINSPFSRPHAYV
jgi:hypothetical protein